MSTKGDAECKAPVAPSADGTDVPDDDTKGTPTTDSDTHPEIKSEPASTEASNKEPAPARKPAASDIDPLELYVPKLEHRQALKLRDNIDKLCGCWRKNSHSSPATVASHSEQLLQTSNQLAEQLRCLQQFLDDDAVNDKKSSSEENSLTYTDLIQGLAEEIELRRQLADVLAQFEPEPEPTTVPVKRTPQKRPQRAAARSGAVTVNDVCVLWYHCLATDFLN